MSKIVKQRAFVVALMCAWVWASHFKGFLKGFFLCDGQGIVRGAIIYTDRPCLSVSCYINGMFQRCNFARI